MKRRVRVIGGLGVLSIVLMHMMACSPAGAVVAEEGHRPVSLGEPTESAPPAADTAPSCANPTPQTAAGCAALAEKILAATVRLEFYGCGGIGHGTIYGGRYLITHNHYPVSGEALSRGGDGLVSAVSVYKANGDVILLEAPLSYFSVVLIAPEALVLDFREYGGVGFFDSVGVPSAESGLLTGLSIQSGSEVAQIDWDMTTARVIWTRVTAIHVTDATPSLELDSYVEQGASGGGVFYNGIHIANNWSRNTDCVAATGEVLRQYSLAALNSGSIVALGGASDVALAGQ